MLADIIIAVCSGLTAAIMAGLGVYVTLHPPHLPNKKRGYKLAFYASGILACGLIGWQSYRNNKTQAIQNAKLDRIETNTSRPIPAPVVNVNVPAIPATPKILPSVSSFTKELPIPAYASHGFPTTEAYITAHGTIDDPVLEVTCDSECIYESALAVNTSTFADPKQISGYKHT